MADEAQPQEAKKKGGMLVPIVAVLMVLEAVGVYFLVSMTGPSAAHGQAPEFEGAEAADQPLELQLLDAAYQNASTGRRWRWEIEVVLLVSAENQAKVEEIMRTRQATIREGVGKIIGHARHSHLEDPSRATVKRQLTALFEEIFGLDGEQEPRVEGVLVPKLTGVVGDY